MSDDNVRLTRAELVRWVICAALLVAALVAYFTFSRSVAPAIPVLQEERASP
jgi:hypothetical protein